LRTCWIGGDAYLARGGVDDGFEDVNVSEGGCVFDIARMDVEASWNKKRCSILFYLFPFELDPNPRAMDYENSQSEKARENWDAPYNPTIGRQDTFDEGSTVMRTICAGSVDLVSQPRDEDLSAFKLDFFPFFFLCHQFFFEKENVLHLTIVELGGIEDG
jgi:hypothetical protein